MILITGGGGFLGRNVAEYFARQGMDVLLFGRRPIQVPSFLAPFWGKQVKGIVGDLLDFPHLSRVIKENGVESIVHGAFSQVRGGNLLQAIRINVEGTCHVLEASSLFGLRRVSFVSSATLYYAAEASLYREDINLPPTSEGFIEAVKKAAEQICILYMKEKGLSVSILRPPRIYGPLYAGDRVAIRPMIENAIAGTPAELSHVCGESKSIYVYVKDCAKGIGLVHLAKAPRHTTYNISDGGSHTYSEFAQAIRDTIPGAVIRLGTVKSAKDADRAPLDLTRIKEEMGFVPEYDLTRGIRDYVQWMKSQR